MLISSTLLVNKIKSKYLDFRHKAKGLVRKNKQITDSASYKKVVGLLSGLGFLIAPEITSYGI